MSCLRQVKDFEDGAHARPLRVRATRQRTLVSGGCLRLDGEQVPRFTEVSSVLSGTQTFGTDKAKDVYRPQYNDDWIGPEVIPQAAYVAAGFARK